MPGLHTNERCLEIDKMEPQLMKIERTAAEEKSVDLYTAISYSHQTDLQTQNLKRFI